MEYLGYNLSEDFDIDYYKEKFSQLPIWDYFVSDLDWTFYRWILLEYVVNKFVEFIRYQDFWKINIKLYHQFIDDVVDFLHLKRKAYNKQVNFMLYTEVAVYILVKYYKLIDWKQFLMFLREEMFLKTKVNPYRFSIHKLITIIDQWINFLFISAASNFMFEIYLDLLRFYMKNNFGRKYSEGIYWISSYVGNEEGLSSKIVYLWSKEQKKKIVSYLKSIWKIKKVVWGMWDTSTDFGLSWAVDKWWDFYFINPEKSVIKDFNIYKIKEIKYHFIFERKDLLFEIDINDIKII